MLLTSETLKYDFKILTSDNEEIVVNDILFDENNFQIRWFIGQVASWRLNWRFAFSPLTIKKVDLAKSELRLSMKSKDLKSYPSPESKLPLSAQLTKIHQQQAGIIPFNMLGLSPADTLMPATMDHAEFAKKRRMVKKENSLRSLNEVKTYGISAEAHNVGAITNFIIDCEHWQIDSIIVDRGRFLSHSVYRLANKDIADINWLAKTVFIAKDGESRLSPFDTDLPVNVNLEKAHYNFYGRAINHQSLGKQA